MLEEIECEVNQYISFFVSGYAPTRAKSKAPQDDPGGYEYIFTLQADQPSE